MRTLTAWFTVAEDTRLELKEADDGMRLRIWRTSVFGDEQFAGELALSLNDHAFLLLFTDTQQPLYTVDEEPLAFADDDDGWDLLAPEIQVISEDGVLKTIGDFVPE